MSDQAIRRLRLGSGVVLFAYILSHLVNHALGAISLDHAEAGLRLAMRLWHSRPGTVLLYGAAVIHVALALRTVFLRRHWRLPVIEILRIASGFSLPLLLIGHVVATRLTLTLFDVPQSYGRTVSNLAASGNEGWQLALLAPGWIHGCLGLWITLRRSAWAQKVRGLLVAAVVALPAAAALGFYRMLEEAARQPLVGALPAPSDSTLLGAWQSSLTRSYIILVVAALVGGQIYQRWVVRRDNDNRSS
ncbi:hypothetical protein [Phreatobacter aquaticus]|uniref:hypothetical protein n=1 Tax=Phreatobacter aquaticus TaxID=2570229 RepID=UPI001C07AD86|nr:hypothetical protein [Phreatobacter aquaticus]